MAAIVKYDEHAHVQSRPEENGDRPQGPVLRKVGVGGKEADVQHCSDDQGLDGQIKIWPGELGDVRLDLLKSKPVSVKGAFVQIPRYARTLF